MMKIPNKREFQQIASSHSPDFGFKGFMKLYIKIILEKHLHFQEMI